MGRCFTELQNKGVGSSVIKTKKQCTAVAAISRQAESVGCGGGGGFYSFVLCNFVKEAPSYGGYFKTGSSRS